MQLEVELTDANLEWLIDAIWHDWPHLPIQSFDRDWKRFMPALSMPNTKWIKRCDEPRIAITWRHANGRFTTTSRRVMLHVEDEDL